MFAQNNRRVQKPSRVTERERYALLNEDPFIVMGSVKPQSVMCAGCGRTIMLADRRTSLWRRHKRQCLAVQNGDINH